MERNIVIVYITEKGGINVTGKNLDINSVENWLWEAACKVRGEIDAPKYKDYILPLVFLKRLSDVFEDELVKLSEKFGDRKITEELISKDDSYVRYVRIYIPENARWENISRQTIKVGQYLTDAVRSISRENPQLQGVIDIVDFNATAAGQRIISDDKLKLLIDVLGRYRLGLKDVEPDILGRAYEYLLRKFAEGSGQSAGEFYTPREVAILMAYILDPQPGIEIYDPCCGSGGLLIKCYLRFREKYGDDPSIIPLSFYGQEIQHTTFAMAKMNVFIHDMEALIKLGDTMARPAFLKDGSSLNKFDIVTANPMWNQNFSQNIYENDPYNRFIFSYPPSNTADWGWIQHMYASLKNGGKMALVIDTGAVSRGSGTTVRNRERDIRREFVERDLIETAILLPENLFYNTTAPGIILVINTAKKNNGEIMLINASNLYKKGRPKNYLPDEIIKEISDVYHGWKEKEAVSRVIKNEEAVANDYNLSPSRYVAQDSGEDVLHINDAMIQLKQAEEERAEVDKELGKVLKDLGLGELK